jgi:hypothetical protein
MPLAEPAPETRTFSCPRCHHDVTEAFYGPCGPCRRRLRDNVGGEARPVVAAAYEPKTNVNPNAVATKG